MKLIINENSQMILKYGSYILFTTISWIMYLLFVGSTYFPRWYLLLALGANVFVLFVYFIISLIGKEK